MSREPIVEHMKQHTSDKIAAAGLILGGLLIIPSGITHPNADHSGGILEQAQSMVADPKWILSSLLLTGAYLGITVGLARLATEGRVHVSAPAVSAAATIGAVLYLFGPSVEDGIVDGNWFSVLMWITHLVTNPMWGLMVVAVGVTGGLSRTVGNRVTAVAAAVGGLCWTGGMLTAPYFESIDEPLFIIAGFALTAWAVGVGAMALRAGTRLPAASVRA